PSASKQTRLPRPATCSLVPGSVRNTTVCRSRTKLTGKTTGPWSSMTATRPRFPPASNPKHSDLVSSSIRLGCGSARRGTGDAGGPVRGGRAERRHPPAVPAGEIPAGEVWLGALGPRRVGGSRHSIAAGAARRGRPAGEFAQLLTVVAQLVLSGLNGGCERG